MLPTPEAASSEEQPATAGRPRRFEPAQALQSALQVFWLQGFEATSLDDLTRSMGLSRSSFYACFGSKQAVFKRAVEQYADDYFSALCTAASAEADPIAGALALLARVADSEGGTQGCFFVNTVTELAPHDPDLTHYCQSHIARVAQLLSSLLVQAGFTPALAEDRAGAALALVMGLITLRKAGIPAQRIQALLGEVRLLLTLP